MARAPVKKLYRLQPLNEEIKRIENLLWKAGQDMDNDDTIIGFLNEVELDVNYLAAHLRGLKHAHKLIKDTNVLHRPRKSPKQ